jgi:uncharacterized protein (DUF1330 family)
MSAYVISEVEVIDEVEGQQYRELAAASIAQYGGRSPPRGRREPQRPNVACGRSRSPDFPSY